MKKALKNDDSRRSSSRWEPHLLRSPQDIAHSAASFRKNTRRDRPFELSPFEHKALSSHYEIDFRECRARSFEPCTIHDDITP
jgi:hypothetical protein